MPPSLEADDQPPPSITVEVFDAGALLDDHSRCALQALTTKALSNLPNTGQVRVAIVDDQRMSIAHQQFSGIAGTTDVLTFDLAHDPGQSNPSFADKVLDTDLTVCYDEAQRQAAQHNHPVMQELLLYIVHGVLHCLGYDDHDENGYQRMHEKEDELLAMIGFTTTFFTHTQVNREARQDTQRKERRS